MRNFSQAPVLEIVHFSWTAIRFLSGHSVHLDYLLVFALAARKPGNKPISNYEEPG